MRWSLAIVGMAFLVASTLRAHSLPASVASSAPAPSSAPAAAPSSAPAPGPAPTSAEIWWQSNQYAIIAAAIGTGVSVVALAAVGYRLINGWNSSIEYLYVGGVVVMLVDALLAPAAIAYGSFVGSFRTGRPFWPGVCGSTLGCIAPLTVVAAGAGVLLTGSVLWSLLPHFPSGQSSSLGFVRFVRIAGPVLPGIVAPAALGGVLLSDLLFQPRPDTPASAPATAGLE